MCLTTLKVFQAPLGITFSSLLVLTPVLNSWILPWGKKKLLPLLKQKDLYKLNDAQQGNFCHGMMTQMTGQREERWQREDGWLQESVATGGQHIPLLAEGSWGTGHDAACARVCLVSVWHCHSLLIHICTSKINTGNPHNHFVTVSEPKAAKPLCIMRSPTFILFLVRFAWFVWMAVVQTKKV